MKFFFVCLMLLGIGFVTLWFSHQGDENLKASAEVGAVSDAEVSPGSVPETQLPLDKKESSATKQNRRGDLEKPFDRYEVAAIQGAFFEFLLRSDISEKYRIIDFTCHESSCRIKGVTRSEHSFASVSDFLKVINEDERVVGKEKTYRVALVSVKPDEGFVSYEMELGEARRYVIPPDLDKAVKILKEVHQLERELRR